MTITEIEQEIIDEFELLGEDWELRYEHLIELGKSLPLIDAKYKNDNHIIKGCQSQVWLHAEIKNQQLFFTADSDAIITKGMIALLIRVFSGQSPEAVLQANVQFIDQIGLKEHLSPTRANGLLSMIKQMKLDALALKEKHNL
ncbi:MAG: SufE family protein [Bacteroidetes bacterium]|nr:SufE family protein [Bacteroidota bacterium]